MDPIRHIYGPASSIYLLRDPLRRLTDPLRRLTDKQLYEKLEEFFTAKQLKLKLKKPWIGAVAEVTGTPCYSARRLTFRDAALWFLSNEDKFVEDQGCLIYGDMYSYTQVYLQNDVKIDSHRIMALFMNDIKLFLKTFDSDEKLRTHEASHLCHRKGCLRDIVIESRYNNNARRNCSCAVRPGKCFCQLDPECKKDPEITKGLIENDERNRTAARAARPSDVISSSDSSQETSEDAISTTMSADERSGLVPTPPTEIPDDNDLDLLSGHDALSNLVDVAVAQPSLPVPNDDSKGPIKITGIVIGPTEYLSRSSPADHQNSTPSPHRAPPPPQRQGVIQKHNTGGSKPPAPSRLQQSHHYLQGHVALSNLVDVADAQPSLPVPNDANSRRPHITVSSAESQSLPPPRDRYTKYLHGHPPEVALQQQHQMEILRRQQHREIQESNERKERQERENQRRIDVDLQRRYEKMGELADIASKVRGQEVLRKYLQTRDQPKPRFEDEVVTFRIVKDKKKTKLPKKIIPKEE